jgi:hypothetical protein
VNGPTLDEIRTAIQEIGPARRTVICSPMLAPQVQDLIEHYNLDGLWSVLAHPLVPDVTAYLVKSETGTIEQSMGLKRCRAFDIMRAQPCPHEVAGRHDCLKPFGDGHEDHRCACSRTWRDFE